jgi:hypothetical protein
MKLKLIAFSRLRQQVEANGTWGTCRGVVGRHVESSGAVAVDFAVEQQYDVHASNSQAA